MIQDLAHRAIHGRSSRSRLRARLFAIGLLCSSGAALAQTMPDKALPPNGYEVTESDRIGGPGRWDYVTVGSADNLLYVTRTTHTLVIDPASGKVVADVAGGARLHGTAVVPSVGRAFVSDGGDGVLIVFDLKSHEVLGKIPAADDADGIIYDAGDNRVLVGCGDAGEMLSLDPTTDLKTAKCQHVDLGGKPEFLAADGKGHAYVNLNDKSEIAVVDLAKMTVTDRWSIGEGKSPTGLAIDAANGRLFIGCRNQKMIVLDTSSGKVIATFPIGRGNDACAFDESRHEAFASCGDGTVAIVREATPDKFDLLAPLSTRVGSRTMAIDPATNRLYLPAADFEPAAAGQRRPAMLPNTFAILVASPVSK